MTPNPLTPCPSCEPLGNQAAEPIFRTALVIDPEALEGRLIQEFAPAAKRRRYCGVFSCEQGLLESDHGSLTDETVPATPQND